MQKRLTFITIKIQSMQNLPNKGATKALQSQNSSANNEKHVSKSFIHHLPHRLIATSELCQETNIPNLHVKNMSPAQLADRLSRQNKKLRTNVSQLHSITGNSDTPSVKLLRASTIYHDKLHKCQTKIQQKEKELMQIALTLNEFQSWWEKENEKNPQQSQTQSRNTSSIKFEPTYSFKLDQLFNRIKLKLRENYNTQKKNQQRIQMIQAQISVLFDTLTSKTCSKMNIPKFQILPTIQMPQRLNIPEIISEFLQIKEENQIQKQKEEEIRVFIKKCKKYENPISIFINQLEKNPEKTPFFQVINNRKRITDAATQSQEKSFKESICLQNEIASTIEEQSKTNRNIAFEEFYEIIKNEGFEEGETLRIKKLIDEIKYREIVHNIEFLQTKDCFLNLYFQSSSQIDHIKRTLAQKYSYRDLKCLFDESHSHDSIVSNIKDILKRFNIQEIQIVERLREKYFPCPSLLCDIFENFMKKIWEIKTEDDLLREGENTFSQLQQYEKKINENLKKKDNIFKYHTGVINKICQRSALKEEVQIRKSMIVLNRFNRL